MKHTIQTDIQQIRDLIDRSISNYLPGFSSHLKMTPNARIPALINNFFQREKAKKSAVLILLYPHNQDVYIVFILRQNYHGHHSGQISFPGGRWEPEDTDFTQTALREAHEEVGVKTEDVEIIGWLSELYIPPTHYIVQPVVGIARQRPLFIPDSREVQEILEFPLSSFLDDNNIKTKQIPIGVSSIKAPCYQINDYVIWGATAMIMAELIDIINA